MKCQVKLFARARDLVGTGEMSVALPEGATVGDLRRALAKQVPALASLLPRCALAVGNDFASDETVIPAGVEVAVLPPVSGG